MNLCKKCGRLWINYGNEYKPDICPICKNKHSNKQSIENQNRKTPIAVKQDIF